MSCIIEGCEQPKMARGWCSTHYSKWWRSTPPEDRSRWLWDSGTPAYIVDLLSTEDRWIHVSTLNHMVCEKRGVKSDSVRRAIIRLRERGFITARPVAGDFRGALEYSSDYWAVA